MDLPSPSLLLRFFSLLLFGSAEIATGVAAAATGAIVLLRVVAGIIVKASITALGAALDREEGNEPDWFDLLASCADLVEIKFVLAGDDGSVVLLSLDVVGPTREASFMVACSIEREELELDLDRLDTTGEGSNGRLVVGRE